MAVLNQSEWDRRCTSCGRTIHYGVVQDDRWLCKFCYMPATVKFSLDKLIEASEKRTAELLAKKEALAKFGSEEDFDEDDAILFKRQFNINGPVYTYVAVKTPVGWYITGANAHRLSFDELAEEYLMHSVEVWHCTEWTQA